MRKPDICISENKGADQLWGNHTSDQRFCFHYTVSKIPPLPKSILSSLMPFSVIAQPGLCQTWSETPKTSFLAWWLIYKHNYVFFPIFREPTVRGWRSISSSNWYNTLLWCCLSVTSQKISLLPRT